MPFLQALVLWHLAHELAHAEVAEDLLGTTEDGVELLRALELLDELAHACLVSLRPLSLSMLRVLVQGGR